MDSFEMNKIMGAVLGACLAVLSINIAAGAIFAPHKPAKPGYEIAVPEPGTGKEPAKPAGEPEQAIEVLLAKAEIAKGETAAKKCAACHTFNKGGKPLVGPNLWGIVGRAKAAEPGFNYSAAMKAKGGSWTIADLDHFLLSPKGLVPGTNMSFAGVPRGTERADLIAYLNSLSDSPAPLPTKAAEAPAPATPPAPQAAPTPPAPAPAPAPTPAPAAPEPAQPPAAPPPQ